MDATTLKTTLSEQIQKLHSNQGDPKIANAISNAAGKIIATIRLELEYCKMVGAKPAISFVKTAGALPVPKEKKKLK